MIFNREEELLGSGAVPLSTFRDRDDIATGAETAACRMIEQDQAYLGIASPGKQRLRDLVHHGKVQRIQRIRTV